MAKLSIMHSTVYQYSRPVVLNEHKLMVRLREGYQLKLISHEVSVSRHASLRWARKILSLSVALPQIAIGIVPCSQFAQTRYSSFPAALQGLSIQSRVTGSLSDEIA